MTTYTGTISGFSRDEDDSSTARVGDITLDTPLVSPRGDSYALARFTTDHIASSDGDNWYAIDSDGRHNKPKYVLTPGQHVQFELNIDPGTYDREAYNVRPA